MKRREFNMIMGATATLASLTSLGVAAGSESVWSLSTNVAESCSCDISCQCNFGRPTKRRCDGSRLVEITEGQIDGADLSGVSFVRTFEMRRWNKIYVDESISEEKKEAFTKIFPLAFSSQYKRMRSMDWVPLSVKRNEDIVRFEVPDSVVEIKLLRGKNGQPITINALPKFSDYVQYESIIHTHKSDAAEFSYSGTNGFTARMSANNG